MADTKKSNVIKENNVNLEDIENAIGGNTTGVEKNSPKSTEKPAETTATFAEKSAEAAATAALKAAIDTNNEIAIRESEKAYFIEKKNYMLNKCKTDEVVTRTISKLYAPIIGKVYTFASFCVYG